jgi:hypothetical protein
MKLSKFCGLLALALLFAPAFAADSVKDGGAAQETHEASGHNEDADDHNHTHELLALPLEAFKDAPADLLAWGILEKVYAKPKGGAGGVRYEAAFVPKEVQALEGKVVSLIGFATPPSGAVQTSQFLLSDTPIICGHCEAPKVTGIVEVHVKNAVSALAGIVTARGKLEILKDIPEGVLYRLNDSVVLKGATSAAGKDEAAAQEAPAQDSAGQKQ